MKKTIKKKIIPRASEYTVSVKILGKFYSSAGKTFMEAVEKLSIPNPKGHSIWTVTHNGTTREKVVMPFITTNLFALKGLAHEIAMKKFISLFAGL